MQPIPAPSELPPVPSFSRAPGRNVRTRIFQGLLVALPVAITAFILHWIYTLLRGLAVDPVARLVVWLSDWWHGEHLSDRPLPGWYETYVAPVIAVLLILWFLYFLGSFFQSRIHRAVDWLLLKAPVVNTIYAAVRKVFATFEGQQGLQKFTRVVLVPFPHAGMRTPAFVTATCRDTVSGKTILCVYVPTTPVPTSGYMLMLPEEDVTELDWSVNDTLQAIVSAGVTAPDAVAYSPGPPPAIGGDEPSAGGSP